MRGGMRFARVTRKTMIYPEHTPDWYTVEALIEAHQAPFRLILDGSRYYGNAGPDSDWDLIVHHDRRILSHFLDKGWRQVDPDKRLDSNTRTILYKGKVQIILARDLKLRLVRREYVRDHYGTPPKGDVDFWDAMYLDPTPHYQRKS